MQHVMQEEGCHILIVPSVLGGAELETSNNVDAQDALNIQHVFGLSILIPNQTPKTVPAHAQGLQTLAVAAKRVCASLRMHEVVVMMS